MKQIDKVLSEIRVAETGDLGNQLVDVLENPGLNDAHVSAISQEIKTASHKLVNAIKKDKAESELDEHDALRDGVYRSLLHLTKGYVHHPDTQIRQSAVEVETVMDKYGFDLVNETYSAESALLESFLADLARPELATKIELLPGVKDLTLQLEDEQKQFKVAEGVWHNAQTEEDKTANATAAKRELLKIINTKLVVYLRGMLQVDPGTYQDLAARVELLIDKTNAAIKRRSAN